MKKVLFVLALVAVYGVSLAMAPTAVVSYDDNSTVVVEVKDNVEKEKEKKATKAEAKGEGCATAKSEKKSEGCATKKSSDCGKSCGGEKKE